MGISELTTRFVLGPQHLTVEQRRFFERWGFLHFEGFATPAEVDELTRGMHELEARLVAERRAYVNGIPVRYGRDPEGKPMVQRFPFSSLLSPAFERFVSSERFAPVLELLGEGARLGVREKDGVVVNHWVNDSGSRYRQLGWHTDSPRDIFLHRRLPGPMLNVGVYLDDSPRAKGGLRIIPGSHHQGLWSTLFGKLYFLDNRPDPREHAIEAKAGDLTIHDGRLWHRVARAELSGAASRRRLFYVPIIDGPYEPKHEDSPVPLYHRFDWIIGG
jgi:hypothetical protein